MVDEVKKFQEDKNLVWENKDKRSLRAMCISYSKDLVVNRDITKEEMFATAKLMFEWVWGE